MRKISNVVTGTALRNTTPAAIEKYLVEKVRNELGEFHDLVLIKPVLRIDKEDGDLSGNVTDGYGTVMLSVGNMTIHLPFIIHEKELLPFDVIRMGGQEVVYDLSKLRKIVIGLDKANKEKAVEGDPGMDAMSVVDGKDISTQNGFLGTIMDVRDSHKQRDVNGNVPYEGLGFGDMDENRLMKQASKEIDIAELFEEFHEKLANVRIFSTEDVKSVVRGIEKKAETEAESDIAAVSGVKIDTKVSIGVQREFAKIDKEKLANYKRAASGNNIKFPVFDDTQFEYRNGRVYHKVKSAFSDSKTPYTSNSKIKHIIVDTRHNYALLQDNDDFMISVEQPSNFDFPCEHALGLLTGEMYAFEWDTETISLPFFVKRQYLEEEENNGILVSVMERTGRHEILKASQSSLFRNSFECEEHGHRFTVVVLRGDSQKEVIRKIDKEELSEYILAKAKSGVDHKISKLIAERFVSGGPIYFVSEEIPFFKMFKNITGYFTRPDGLFKEGPLFEKSAAYEQANKARLYINSQKRPATYSVEWSYADEKSVEGETGYGLEKKRMDDLAPAQAKQILQDLGYDHRKQESFFEIAKRNGRYAEFNLPNVEVAKEVTPKDKAIGKAKDAVRNIANSTLNAGNFVPVFENVMADTAAEYISQVVPGSVDWVKNIQSKVAESESVAIEFEKVATEIRGSAWSEVAYVLNMKHHLDKLALDITTGFVKGAEEIFSDIQQLGPTIEKIASGLIEFNRDQQLRVNAPLVKPELIKEALAQLDDLCGYIKTGEEMEKSSFFHQGTHKKIDELAKTMIVLRKKNEKNVDFLKSQSVNMRALNRTGMGDTKMGTTVARTIEDTKKKFIDISEEIGENAKEQQRLLHKIETKNRAAMAGVGLPSIAAFSYNHHSSKDK